MGISGLLPFLKDATSNTNIKQFEGATVAVDTYCWIYRGAFGCAEELALGHQTDGHVKYVVKYVKKLLEWGIKPIMVFDGSCLPSKKETEAKRRENKETYRKKAAQCLLEGKRNEARECYQRCIECTPKMAVEVIKAMHGLGVDVLVAPYEADAQLAYLSKINCAQIIITEDSDLILFGCEKIFYKLDMNGDGQLVEKSKIISVTQFDSADNFERFRWMCILSGCDYLENLPGIGLGKAKKLLKQVKKNEIEQILKQASKVLKMPNLNVTNDYIEKFKKADNTFKYQVVFDPLLRKLVSINPYGENDAMLANEDLTYAGFFYDDNIAFQHSLGNLHVNNREIVYDFNPNDWNYKPPLKYSNNTPSHMKSIWSKSYKTNSKSNFVDNLFANNKNTSNENLINNMPNTTGLSKIISSNRLVDSNKKLLQNESNNSTGKNNKRKHDELISSSKSSDECDIQDEEEEEDEKRMNLERKKSKCLLNSVRVEENDVVSQYFSSENKTSQANIDSGYFTCSNTSSHSIPLLSSYNSSLKSTNQEESPTCDSLDERLSLVMYKNDSPTQITATSSLIDSPIVVESKAKKTIEKRSESLTLKSSLLETFSAGNLNKTKFIFNKSSSSSSSKYAELDFNTTQSAKNLTSNLNDKENDVDKHVVLANSNTTSITKTVLVAAAPFEENKQNKVSSSSSSITSKKQSQNEALVKNNSKITEFYTYKASNKFTFNNK